MIQVGNRWNVATVTKLVSKSMVETLPRSYDESERILQNVKFHMKIYVEGNVYTYSKS